MSNSLSALESIQQLMASVEDANTLKILQALSSLAERIDELRVETSALRTQFARLEQSLTESPPSSTTPTNKALSTGNSSNVAPWLEPPVFTTEISEYDRGVLFENDEGFDLKVQFSDPKSWEWYRIWGFRDAGHVLHVLLEACARTQCAEMADKFTYRRDSHSATVYATQRPAIERLRSRFLQLCETDEGTLQLIECMNLGLSE